jgi:putative DNA primase/helicase
MVIFGKSKNLDITSENTFEPSPKWFNQNALDFDFNVEKKPPLKWEKFMNDLFENDVESYQTLMMFMGLLLTPITKFQKALLIVGPKRSGKGTIGRIIRKLVGIQNVCSPTTDGLTEQFGLQTLIGKSVAIISDARFNNNKQNLPTLIERILNITGEDALTIDRKFKSQLNLRLPTRFVFFSNEIPQLLDSSGALASRFIILKLTKSFYENPNLNLENELSEELPQILDLAIFWLKQLLKQGHFTQPQSAKDEMEIMEDLGSPIKKFIRETCILDFGNEDYWTSNDEIWKTWKTWSENEGIYQGNKVWFIRNLHATEARLLSRVARDNQNKIFKKQIGIMISREYSQNNF